MKNMSRLRALAVSIDRSLKTDGVTGTFKKAVRRIIRAMTRILRARLSRPYRLSSRERQRQSAFLFSQNITISLIVPLYNTPQTYLTELIESVKSQTYSRWQLCLADGSDDGNTYVEKICREAAQADSRIIYRRLEHNFGISENTNRCIEMSSGEYLGLLDHDDLLHPAALFEVMTAIGKQSADFIYTDENTFRRTPKDAYLPNFKPDFAPDMLRSQNYICHFTVFARVLLEKVGLFRSRYDGSQDYDMVLRLTEMAEKIIHIPKILYYWRASSGSVASDVGVKCYAIEAARAALTQHLKRMGLDGTVEDSRVPSTYRIRYRIKDEPRISILIPNKDHAEDLKKCIETIISLTTYQNYEIVIVENGSEEPRTFALYEYLRTHKNIRIEVWTEKFNYSAINNFGFQYTCGEYVLLLNNDIIVITPDWLQEMLMFAQRPDVGAVGAMLYYPDDTIQHAGVIVGLGGVAGHSHKGFKRGEVGFMYRTTIAQNLSAVTAACMMLPRYVYEEVGGLDETFEVAFNDVDMCMRIRKAGYLIVFTPYAEMYHCESKSRGIENTPTKRKRFEGEVFRFKERWAKELKDGDPYYNINLTLDNEKFLPR